MSHFTRIKTSINDLSTLQSVLTQLNLSWEKISTPIQGYQNQTYNAEVIIHQSNAIDIGFAFNRQSYELIADKSFWRQPWSMESFLDKINQVYSVQLINKELRNIGFSTVSCVNSEQDIIDVIAEKWIT